MTTAAHGQAVPARVVRQEYFELELRCDSIVWVKRGFKPYTVLADIHKAYDQLLSAVDDWLLDRRIANGRLGTREWTPMAWLFDVRAVSIFRNDDAFERAVQRRQSDLIKRSQLMAVLVKTATGRMQMNRLRRGEDQGDPEIFDDTELAIHWLLRQLKDSAPNST